MEISGSGVAATAIGQLDIGLTTMTEVVTRTRNIANSISLPLGVDAGQGFGNPMHVIRTVKELESAGASAMMIDDKVMETCPWLPNKAIADRYWRGIISEDEMEGKIKAAAYARTNDNFIIKFRSNARGPALRSPLEPALNRCKKAIECGADIVHANAKSLEELGEWNDLGVPLEITLNACEFLKGKTFDDIARLGRNIKWINIGTRSIYVVANKLLEALTAVRKEGIEALLSEEEMSRERWMDLFQVNKLSDEIESFMPPATGAP